MRVDAVRTKRLSGEALRDEHFDDLCRLLGNARVGQTLGGAWPPARVRDRLDAHVDHWREHGFGLWLWRTGEALVGWGGLHRIRIDGADEVEVGWAVMPDLWGQGYATELGAASLETARTLGLGAVVAFTTPGNAPSRRVMEKLGMRYEKDIVHQGEAHVLYRAQE